MFLCVKNVDLGLFLSIILGNFGVNIIVFCKEFNEFIKELLNYFLIEVIIIINGDRIYNFNLKEFIVVFLLKLVVKKIEILKKGLGGLKIDYIKVIKLYDIYLICLFKFNFFENFCLKNICSILVLLYYFII